MLRASTVRLIGRPLPRLPWLTLLAALAAAPALLPLAVLGLRAVEAGPQALGALASSSSLAALWRTLALTAAVAASSAALALPLAWLTVRSDLPARGLIGALAPLPLALPSYVAAYLWIAALGPSGLPARLLSLQAALWPSFSGFGAAWLCLTLLCYPYPLLTVQSALRRMDPALEEAGRALGSGAWRTFARVTLPALRPALAAGTLLAALYTIRDFGAVSLLRYDTYTRVLYLRLLSSLDREGTAVLALAPAALALLVLALHGRVAWSGGGRPPEALRPARAVGLGAWRAPALVACLLVLVLALGLPTAELAHWLVRGLAAGQALPPGLGAALLRSLLAGGLAAAATALLALPLAALAARRGGRGAALLERLAYVGSALPGIVVALAIVFAGVRFARPLYQTLPLLILAYAALFAAQAVGAQRAAWARLPARLEEAARSLGRGRLAVLRTVTLPLLAPGVLAGAGLVFLTTMKELPATLLLAPYGYSTLATLVWSSVSEAFFARAAAPALLLIAASALPLLGLARERQGWPA